MALLDVIVAVAIFVGGYAVGEHFGEVRARRLRSQHMNRIFVPDHDSDGKPIYRVVDPPEGE